MIITSIALLTLLKTSGLAVNVTLNGKPATDSVVWFKQSGKITPGRFDVVQKGKKFVPRILAVPTGSTVGFPNRDDVFHNVFAEYNAKKFDLGMYPKNQTRSVKFDKPGVVSVLCNVHSNMSAFVIVVDSNYLAKADRKGVAKFAEFPSGKVAIEAWHESGATFSGFIDTGSSSIDIKLKR